MDATLEANTNNIIKYLLYRFGTTGDFVSNLKMQKLLYYVYVWYLVKFDKRAFEERMQAWPIGPVLPSAYRALKQFGSNPIDINYSEIKSADDLVRIKTEMGDELTAILDAVYETYGTKSAFELVNLTHAATPWKSARKGAEPEAKSSEEIQDADITSFYGADKARGA